MKLRFYWYKIHVVSIENSSYSWHCHDIFSFQKEAPSRLYYHNRDLAFVGGLGKGGRDVKGPEGYGRT